MSRYVVGTGDFTELARRMHAAGSEGKGLRREITKTLRQGVTPLVDEARDNVDDLPVRGVKLGKRGKPLRRDGASARAARAAHTLRNRKRPSERLKQKAYSNSRLRVTVARAVSAKVTTSAASASLRVRAAQRAMPPDQRRLPRYLNRGRWRHPVFGNKRKWVEQVAPPAWFDDAAEHQGPIVRGRTLNTVDTYLKKLV